ncbi:TetR/AcrR family transcriptional regulator [Haloarchaeobius amylolyticus]|uniref:TetR/AcrR family transcriptional regulator n=1 Tax=Haloarchaeobius amylolyticus TaxID=1198296 RepID=UPI0022709871|nr:TetR/AcrR family transcriptional regulator [Haloarchaeobius amylolyticus]
MSDGPFTAEPTDTREKIMHATFRALREYGYAGLSIQRIADEAGLSKSSFYHFYDGKDDLLLSFMEFMYGQFGSGFDIRFSDDPVEDLRRHAQLMVAGPMDEDVAGDIIDTVPGEVPPDAPIREKNAMERGPLVEVRAQGVNEPAFRERFTDIDAAFRGTFADIIERGIIEGVFREVDATQVADMLVTIGMGTIFRGATSTFDREAAMAEVDAYVEERLLADDVTLD